MCTWKGHEYKNLDVPVGVCLTVSLFSLAVSKTKWWFEIKP